jgi:hypothetical protein
VQFTAKGRIRLYRGDAFISQHTVAEEAYEAAHKHAQSNGPGKYTVKYPDREIDVTLLRTVLETPPTGLTAQAISASQINLSWTANPRAEGYRLYRNGTLIASPTGTTYSDTGLTASTSYSYTIASVGSDGQIGTQSGVTTGSTLPLPDTTAPTVPTGLAVAVLSTSGLRVTWNASTDSGGSGLAGYKLERSANGTSGWTQVYDGTARTFDDSGLSSGTTYYYRVRAYDGAANHSSYSSTASGATSASTLITAVIAASRLSGPAPLAVAFDGIQSTAAGVADPFRELGYKFNFDDPDSGTWEYSGKSKNEEAGGPLAAHVFETPGTYEVLMTARRADGGWDQDSVTITVTDPNTVYSGTNTVCLSRTTDHTGAPTGATRLSNVTSWPSWTNGRRYLLRAGQDFSSLGQITLRQSGSQGSSDVQLGSYGSGAKPITGDIWIDSGNSGSQTWPRRIVVMNLNPSNILSFRGAFDLLLFRNTITTGEIELAAAWAHSLSVDNNAQWDNPTGAFVVENYLDSSYGGSGITGNGTYYAVMGNFVDRTTQHNTRFWQLHKSFIGHNSFTGRIGDNIRHTIKLHAGGLEAVDDFTSKERDQRTSHVVIAKNLLGSSGANINWLLSTAPQNNVLAEGLEDIIVEDNEFRYGTNYFEDYNSAGRRITERGNWNVTANRAARNHHDGDGSLPAEWKGPYYLGGASITTQEPVR